MRIEQLEMDRPPVKELKGIKGTTMDGSPVELKEPTNG